MHKQTKSRKAQKIILARGYDIMVYSKNKKAREIFDRPAYGIKRGEAIGQAEINTVSSVKKRNTEAGKRH